ncbi:MAG: ATP-binding protein [Nitrospirota bacterium]
MPYHLIIIFVILITGIGVVGYFSYLHQKKHIIREIHNELFAVADLKVKQIDNWRRERTGNAIGIMENRITARRVMEYLNNPAPESKQDIIEWLKSYESRFLFTGAFLFDTQIRLQLASNKVTDVGPHFPTDALRSIRNGDIIFGDLHRNKSSDEIHLDIYVPVIYDEGKTSRIVGLVMLQINPGDFLFPLIQQWPSPSRTAETILVRRDGDEVVFLNELRHKKNTALSLRFPVSNKTLPAAMLVSGVEGIVEGIDYRGVPVFAALRSIPGSPWYLIAKVDKDEIEAPIRSQAVLLALITLASILAAALSVILWWRGQTETELKKSEERYRSTLDNMLEGCQIIGFDWQYHYINEAAAKHGRRPKEDFIGHAMTELYPGIDDTIMFRELQRTMDDRTPRSLENEFFYPDGSGAWFELSIQPVPEGIFILSIDVTERKATEQELLRHREHLEELVEQRTAELKAVNKELEAFSYSVSHDLKIPLRAVDGFSSVLLEDYADRLDNEGRRILNIIRSSSRQMSLLINDLLNFARISRQQMNAADIDMNSLIKDVLEELGPSHPDRPVEFRIMQLPPVRGDRTMVRQTLLNLLTNAVKFTRLREKAVIEVGSEIKDNKKVFYVKDNGVGFDMRYVDKLFGVFQRLHSAEEFEGTGVGLAIVQRVIHRHGGTVWAEGRVDGGAAFYFSLPDVRNVVTENNLVRQT